MTRFEKFLILVNFKLLELKKQKTNFNFYLKELTTLIFMLHLKINFKKIEQLENVKIAQGNLCVETLLTKTMC